VFINLQVMFVKILNEFYDMFVHNSFQAIF